MEKNIVSIKDEKGKEYKFETDRNDIVLLTITRDRIIGYYLIASVVIPTTWKLNGEHVYNVNNTKRIDLTPYDEFSDLKRVQSEGAIIEMYREVQKEWRGKKGETFSWTSARSKYRIKGGISIASWDAHKEHIMAWWEGSSLFCKGYLGGYWAELKELGGQPSFFCSLQYKTEIPETVMTIDEVAKKLGIKNLRIKGKK